MPRLILRTRRNSVSRACLWAGLLLVVLPGLICAETKKEAVEYETGFYYTVKKGDTLWGLSKKFSDNEWEWPEMWKNNDQIPNPHLIYPGERIRIYQKSKIEEMVRAEEPAIAVAKPEVKEPPFFYYSPIEQGGFILKEPLSPMGSIFKVREDKGMISQGDIVYIRPTSLAAAKPGEQYTVYRTMEPYEDVETGQIIGTQHYLTGVVEIEGIQTDYMTARVVKSYRTIRITDLLTPYVKRSPKIILTPSPPGISGTILVAEEQEQLIGTNYVVFIDKGSKDGIRAGQQYRIFETERTHIDDGDKGKTAVTKIDYATFIVLFTKPDTSTALVTQAVKNVSPGAKFHSPPI